MFNIRRRLLALACTAGIFGGVALSPAINVLAAEEAEPNDSEKSATKISVDEDVKGNLKDNNDTDWYQFTVDKDGIFNVSFSHEYVDSGNVYWQMKIYDSDMVPMHDGWKEYHGNYREVSDSQNWGIAAGTYYIEVRHDYWFSDVSYTLKVNYKESDAWEHESNDAMNSAQKISVNKDITGALNKSGDKDWYQFTLSDAGVVSYSFKHDYIDSSNKYWRACLYDEDGVELKVVSEYEGNNRATDTSWRVGLPAGTYYFGVDTSYWWSAYADYTFNIVFDKAPDWETEDNSTMDLADEMKLNETINGSRPKNDDVDYYKIVIPSNVKAEILFGHKRIDQDRKYWRITLLDKSGDKVAQYESLGTTNGVITLGNEELSAGTYYVKVDTSYWTCYYDYSLAIMADTSIPDGLNKADDGNWYYYKNGEVATDMNGFVDWDGSKFFLVKGMVDKNAKGLVQDIKNTADWYYCADGQAQTQYTGLAQYDGEWFYVEKGKLNTELAAYVKYDGGLFFVGAGRIMTEVNGLAKDPNGSDWYYLANGQAQTQYTGLAQYNGGWFYVTAGRFAQEYTGEVGYNGASFRVVKGEVVQ